MPASFPKKHPVLLFLLFIFLIFQTPLIGQATYDANGASSAGNPSITVPAGQNRVVIVHAATFGTNMSATFNGMSMSVAVSASPSGWVGRSTIFYLPLGTGPAITASANVTGGGGGGPAKHVWVGSFHNVDQTSPIAASGSATNLGASTTIGGLTTMAAMDILLDGINTTNPATGGSPQGGGARIQDASYSSSAAHACARYRQSVGGTESMVWNYSGGPDRAHTAIAINGIPPCIDMTTPSITCIGNQNINFDPSCQASLPDYTMTVPVTDDCGIATFVQSPSPGTMVNTTTAVTLTATDFSGKTSMCNFNVTPVDNTPPVLTCPANIMVNNTTGMCGASVTFTAPSASDNCTSSLTVVCSPPSGSFFAVGTTTVTCTSMDAAGNMGMCTFTVTVNDTESPTIICPGNITQSNDAGQCGAIVTFSPMIGDNCPGATVTCVPASGSFFPVGTTSVTCTVTDGAGNMNMCSFNVTVNDTEDPVITCPANIIQVNDVGQCGAIVTFAPMLSDNCPGSTVLCSPASGSFFPVGITMVTCTVTDAAGNQDVCSFNVTVNDAEAPMITCPMNITQANDAGQCGAIVTFTPMISDNCPGATVTCVPASGSFFPVGTTPVSCTVTDAAGLTSMCSFNVTVNDTENPTITCPANISVNNDPGTCGAVVTYATPTIGDNCPGTTVSCIPVSGSIFPVGTTMVNCTATDAVGNMNFCSFSVTVTDNEPPVWQIADMGNVLADNDPGTGPTGSYNLGNIECDSNSLFTATGIDNCDGSITASTAVQLISLNTTGGNAVKPTTVNISDDMAGNYTVDIVWGLGTTTVVLSMMDAVGNSSNLTLVATTTDTEPPFWTLYDATSTAIADNDPTSVPVTSYIEPMFVLDPSICGVHSTYTADGVDSCFGQIFLADALSVANIVSGSTLVPTTASVMGDGAGNYSIDIFWGVGTSTVTLAMMDPQGNSSNLTIQATVDDPLAGNIAPNAHDLNLSLDVSGNVSFQLFELAGNVSCSDPVDVLVETESGIKVYFGQGLVRSDYIEFAACIYRGRKLKATVTGPGGSAWGYLMIHDGLLPIMAPGRSKDVYCFDPLVNGGAIDGKLPEAYSPCIGPLVVTHAADWIKPYECGPPFSASNDTVKVIYREYETFDKNGNRASVIDTITVFGLPPISVLTSVNAYCAEKDTTYCGEGFAGPYMVFPERCEPSLPLGPGNDPDMDGSFCDTLYFLVYDSLMNMWVENPVFAESKCGISVHLDKKTFGSSSCEQQTKYILQIKQDCIGTPQPSCIVDPALWPDNAFEEVATGYFQCEFWLIDLDTVAPWIKIKEPAVWASTSDHECAAHTYISPLYVHDDWSGVKQVKARIEGVGSYLLNYNTDNKCYESHTLAKLPYKEGPYYVVYEAYDSCHNMYADTGFIYVKDDVRPVAVSDKGMTVSLSDKKVWVDATTFDEGSWDNCGVNLLLARRTDWYEACIDLCDSIDTCWVSEHEDTLWQAWLEPDKHLDPVEAHYAKTLEWLCYDEGACGEIIYNAWIYDLMKYATIHCQEHPYEVDGQYFRHLIEQGWSEGLYKKFKNSTYLLGGSQTGLYHAVDIDQDTSEFIGNIPLFITEIEYDFKTKRLFGTPGGGQSLLFELDPETGAVISAIPHKFGAINGLEFIHGKLYGTYIPFSGEPSVLVVIDPATATIVEIGPTGFGPVPGLAYDDCSDILYGVTNGFEFDENGFLQYVGEKLIQIDLATGAGTEVGLVGYESVGSIEFAADGVLYGGLSLNSSFPGYLIEINPGTGAGTLRGDLALPITGLTSTNQTNCVKNQLDIYEQIGGGWSDAVPFSCEDACGPVTVEILVMDYWCNWSKAWTNVWVEDKTPITVAKDVVDGTITCKVYKDNDYTYPGEEHPVSIEYIIEQAKNGEQDAYAALDGIFGGYCKAWVDPYGNFVDIDGYEIDCDIPFYDSVCYCTSYYEQVRVYDDHLGYLWVDSLVTHCYYEPDTLNFQKGIVAANCAENVHCEQEVWCDFDHCGQGYIYRKFKIWSSCAEAPADSAAHIPDTIYRHQKIYVGNECELNKYMFDVPGDVEVFSCNIEYGPDGNVVGVAGPENTGYAEYLFDDDCRIVGIAHQDKVFKIVGGDAACYKILRTWYFADWCNYGGDVASGSWWLDPGIVVDKCVQKIIVTDTVPPVCLITGPVESGDTVTLGACEYTLDVDVDAMDECGLINYYWELKDITDAADHLLIDSGSDALGGGAEESFSLSIEGLLPGTYKLKVEVQDECTNESYCEYVITVASGKKPTPVCITSLTARLTPWDSDGDGEVDSAHAVVWAYEFDRSSTPACGDDSLAYRIEFLDGTEDDETAAGDLDYLDLGCADIGSKIVRMWVISLPSDTRDYCDAVLVVQSDGSGCPETQGSGGDVMTYEGDMAHMTPDRGVKSGDQNGGVVVSGDAGFGSSHFENGYLLEQNRPNPFQHETSIGFVLPESMPASLEVYDLTGRLIKAVDGSYVKGYNTIRIEKKDLNVSGVLYYRLRAGDYVDTKKMIVIE